MTENESRVLKAAIKTMSRYGVRKTSVGDISETSGLSRRTIYNLFDGREEILRAAFAYAGDTARARLRDRLSQLDTISDQLDAIFDQFVVQTFQYSRRSPNAHDLSEASHEVASDVLKASFRSNAKLIEEVLRPFEARLKKRDLTARDLATQIEIAGRSYKRDAQSLAQLKRLIAAQKTMVLLAIA